MNEPAASLGRFQGLASAEVRQRLQRFGYNELPRGDRRDFLAILRSVLAEPMFILLLAAAGLYLLLGDLGQGLLLAACALLSVGLVVFQERRSERVLEKLSDLASPRALVIRDGREERIPGREVVPGDLILVAEGDRVPADAALLTCHGISADESLLTGESVPVRKRIRLTTDDAVALPGGEDQPFVYSGSLITQGQGLAEVLATGSASRMGQIGLSLGKVNLEETPLQRAIGRLVRVLALTGFGLSLALAVLVVRETGDWWEGLLAGITLAMSALPEEFPMVLMVFLALGAWRLSRHQVLARRAAAIETLGAATVLCVDKTGTLTQNRMTVARLYAADGAVLTVAPETASLPEDFHRLIEFAILASRPRAVDPMESAVHRLGAKTLAGSEHLHGDWSVAEEYELSPRFLAMSQAWRGEASGFVVAAKGAPEAIGDLCHLAPEAATRLAAAVQDMASRGLRVIAVAGGHHPGPELPAEQHDFDFDLIGLIGLADPLRASVPAAIAECRGAGITVAMVTGDYAATAEAIAREAGLDLEGGVLSGGELAALDDRSLAERLRRVRVFARIMPEQKLRLVEAFKANGEVVAMTGDGVNDAPALKAAHIGVAMGRRGTDVAREAAGLVLLEDDFGAIVQAVRLGRRIFGNLRKAMAYIMAIHVPIAGLALLPLLIGWPVLFFPVHIVFLEMIIDPVCSIVFEGEPEEPGVMRRPPRKPTEPLFARVSLAFSLLQGGVVLAAVLLLYGLTLPAGTDIARGLAFTALVAANLALVLVNRSWSVGLWRSFGRRNPAVWIVILAAGAVLVLALGMASLRGLFHFAPSNPAALLGAVALGAGAAFWLEIPKAFGLLRRLG
ncbi:MAG TPA: cation-translocating P-type ATPase [Dongiaceae bacterium]|nr:cation-translocating P-type ATPase [Dongiaceae bacterium]